MSDNTIIAFIGVVVSGAVSWIVALVTLRADRSRRQGELALKIAEMISSADDDVRLSAMRRFAVGVVKIVEPGSHPEAGNVYFLPMNSRITIGRDNDNDIVLFDTHPDEDFVTLSRWHCGFFADQKNVWIDDYSSTNGTWVNDERISKPRLLADGDKILVGQFGLLFRTVRRNTILGG